MTMFSFLGLGGLASSMGGMALGASVTHLMHKYTTGKNLDKLEERLGGADEISQQRTVRKIAILKVLAHRDGDFSLSEQVFIYRYIMRCNELPTDMKVALALELDEPPPLGVGAILDRIRSMLSFSDLFDSEEEAAGFVRTMYNLALADDRFDPEEAKYIEKICLDCKIPLSVIPK